MVEDLSQFFNVTEFAHQAVLDHVEVAGVYNAAPVVAFEGFGGGIAAHNPTFELPSASCQTVQGQQRQSGRAIYEDEIVIVAHLGYRPAQLLLTLFHLDEVDLGAGEFTVGREYIVAAGL